MKSSACTAVKSCKFATATILLASSLSLAGCSPGSAQATDPQENAPEALSLEPKHFIAEGLLNDIRTEERALADGSKALCYIIETKSTPIEHDMGPWCPKTIKDSKADGGVWFKDGTLYDVDGPFIKSLAALYDDPAWKLYRDDGSVKVTDTKEAFEAAARPDVDPRYQNYCVEAPPEYAVAKKTTYIIPVKPKYLEQPMRTRRGAVGVAFNGVNFDPPAPVDHIVGAHTIAPLDDGGGHVNPHAGYHYHAVTGLIKEVQQTDLHSPLIGYALDGYGLYGALKEGDEPTDECDGHSDKIRGYHYHVGKPGENRIIRMFRGVPGSAMLEGETGEHPGPDGRRPPPPPHPHPHEDE